MTSLDDSQHSYIDFGVPNTAAMTDPADTVYIDIIDNNIWWTNHITGIRWGSEMNDATEYATESTEALTDTGSSCIIGPYTQLATITKELKSQLDTAFV